MWVNLEGKRGRREEEDGLKSADPATWSPLWTVAVLKSKQRQPFQNISALLLCGVAGVIPLCRVVYWCVGEES